MASERIGIVVGLAAEARLARLTGCLVAIGGGTPDGAAQASRHLIAQHVTMLVSFGLAGGLDPMMRPGDLIVPEHVLTNGFRLATSASVNDWLGGTTGHSLLGSDRIAVTRDDKRRLFLSTGCAAIDLESGPAGMVAAEAGVAFGVLRAICDPGSRTLPPAALAALDGRGIIGLGRVLGSILRHPRQIPALLALARDAAAARQALISRAVQCGSTAGIR